MLGISGMVNEIASAVFLAAAHIPRYSRWNKKTVAWVRAGDQTLYQQVIGFLIYLVTGTRPDFAFVTMLLSQPKHR